MKKGAEKAIKEMVQRIVEQFQPEKIILFGSYARGTAGPDSDVDIPEIGDGFLFFRP